MVAREQATRAPAVPVDIDNNIPRPPAGIHARARMVRDAKRKSPPDIVHPGRPPKEPGKHTSLMHPQPLAEVHPFTPTMKAWRQGIPVDCGPNWNWDVITAAVAHGPHPTARTQDSIALFAEDIEGGMNFKNCDRQTLKSLRWLSSRRWAAAAESSSIYHSLYIRTSMASSQSLKRA